MPAMFLGLVLEKVVMVFERGLFVPAFVVLVLTFALPKSVVEHLAGAGLGSRVSHDFLPSATQQAHLDILANWLISSPFPAGKLFKQGFLVASAAHYEEGGRRTNSKQDKSRSTMNHAELLVNPIMSPKSPSSPAPSNTPPAAESTVDSGLEVRPG